ncbi:MAG TPA: sodium-dependent bicarbonate transport family permease [Chthonomonadales bacterium]|nr:sodium-dependent bicarbonate transport family permease [Chthonomonadales bacterium]
MNLVDVILAGFFTPVIMFFILGMVTTLVKSDLEIPEAMSRSMAIFLMVAIGLRGGSRAVQAIKEHPELLIVVTMVAVLAAILGVLIAVLTATIMRKVAKLRTADAWAAGGHYGAVSSATLALACSLAAEAQKAAPDQLIYVGWMPAMYPFMDSPALLAAIIVGRIALAREAGAAGVGVNVGKVLHHSIFGLAVWLLISSLIIGTLTQIFSPNDLRDSLAFFDGMFRGVLALFLLDMGMVAARRLAALRELGSRLWKVVLLAWALPTTWGFLGILAMFAVHCALPGLVGWGDAFVFAAIAGGCSYISAPIAMKVAMPEANPSISLPMALALTFPFNVIVNMTVWQIVCRALWGA